MKVTPDTNVLVRAIVADDAKQAKTAQTALKNADTIAITSVALCEFVWVLMRGYGLSRAEVAAAVRGLAASANVEANRPAINAGLLHLDAGGDFADGVIAFEGAALGGETFVSFDKDAIAIQRDLGGAGRLLT